MLLLHEALVLHFPLRPAVLSHQRPSIIKHGAIDVILCLYDEIRVPPEAFLELVNSPHFLAWL